MIETNLKTVIYGASDDLLEIEGLLSEEMNPSNDEPNVLGFSDGTLLQIEYDDDGIWRIKMLRAGDCEYFHEQGSVEQDTPDKVTLVGDLQWAVLATRGQYNPVMR
ncbi:MAG: hypothetical protein WC026_15640 [Hyphomicrobium sp.]|uniref:hypothetical protein n=1 Tax=Hyphomicrobium sp. TaxID=82 RepID=UPI0035671D04